MSSYIRKFINICKYNAETVGSKILDFCSCRRRNDKGHRYSDNSLYAHNSDHLNSCRKLRQPSAVVAVVAVVAEQLRCIGVFAAVERTVEADSVRSGRGRPRRRTRRRVAATSSVLEEV